MYNIKLYKSTGFDSVNVPDSIELLDTGGFEKLEFEDINLVQDRYLVEVILTVSPSDANCIDFAVVENNETNDKTCYVVDSYKMMTEDTCQFDLLLEPYSTLGGFKLDSGNTIVGSAKRCHISIEDDEKNFYPNEEPFEPGLPITWDCYKLLEPSSDTKTIVETLSLPAVSYQYTPVTDVIKEFGNLYQGKDTTKWMSNYVTRAYNGGSSGGLSIISGTTGDESTGNWVVEQSNNPQPRPMISTLIMTPEGRTIRTGTRWWFDEDRKADEVFFYNGLKKEGDKMVPDGKNIEYEVTSDIIGEGRTQDISAYWEVPETYIDLDIGKTTSEENRKYTPLKQYCGGIGYITSKAYDLTIPNTSLYVPFNKKLLYGQNKIVKVYCPASGESIDKQICDIKDPNETPITMTDVKVKIIADIRPKGSPIFFFKYLHDVDNETNMVECIKGGQWRQVVLNETGTYAGEAIERLQQTLHRENTMKQLEYYDQQSALDFLTGGLGFFRTLGNIRGRINKSTVGGITQGAMRLGGAGKNFYNSVLSYDRERWTALKAIADQNTILNAKGAFASITINSPSIINYATDIGKNTFYAIVSTYDTQDAIMFDRFLTMFGYNVGNKWMTNELFNNRPAYNFIQINDCNITSTKGNLSLVNDVIDRLKTGLRIWHKKPEVTDYGSNSNR